MNPQRAQREIQLVLNHDQVRLRSRLVLAEQLPHREAAQIHERLGLGQQYHLIGDYSPRRQRPALPIPHFHTQIAGDPIDRQKSQVMRRELILDSGIAETNNQFHARRAASEFQRATDSHRFSRIEKTSYPFESSLIRGRFLYLFSFFSAFSGAASAPSSSVSCLPFLMTSGSAGAAAASAATASGVATTSSFTEVTCATGWFSSVRNLILSECGKSETRSTLPNVKWLTSTSMWLGMSAGRHSISTSRSICSRMPPSCFTPAASPVSSIGTLTRSTLSSAMRFRSMCSKRPLIGSYCQSTIMALVFSPSRDRSKIVLCPVSEFSMRVTTRGSTVIGSEPLPAP